MPQAIVMPKLGNTVESAIILSWRVGVGDAVNAGEALCEIETDKATLEVESSASGILLARFFEEGDEVPVMQNIAVVGRAGESFDRLSPSSAGPAECVTPQASHEQMSQRPGDKVFISPRAQNLAQRKGIDYSEIGGTGPDGRIIERDIQALIDQEVKVSPVARAMLESGEYQIADEHVNDNRISKSDLAPSSSEDLREGKASPLTGVRKLIAQRMLESVQNSAQLTLHASADATALQAFRARLKSSDDGLGLRGVTINDLLLFAVARTLPAFPELNALFEGDRIVQHVRVHLGMAVDTPRALLAPVIRSADALSLRVLSAEAKRLADACRNGHIMPDELAGGSFTVTNLGGLGIESFTPILNPPQVGILGIGSINLKPVDREGAVEFVPHIGLSLTVNHQVIDGAPAARFLARLSKNISNIELLLAV